MPMTGTATGDSLLRLWRLLISCSVAEMFVVG